jgi:hypothetical protein
MQSPALRAALFSLNDPVRLLAAHGDVLADSVGRILGTLPGRSQTAYVVGFVEEKVDVLELRSDEIAAVHDFHAVA